MIRILIAKYEWCFSRLNWNKIDAADGITGETAESNRNNVFRTNQTTNKIPPKIFKRFQIRKKLPLMYWRPMENMKGKCCAFADLKQSNTCARCLSSGNCNKIGNVEACSCKNTKKI